MALLDRQEPDHNVTSAAVGNRAFQIAVISTRLSTIYSSGDARKMRTADLGFDFQIDGGLWALCPTTAAAVQDCLVGACFDKFLCSKGCGYTDRTLGTISCTNSKIPFCSTAILTHQKAVEPVTNFACGADDDVDVYMGFTTDPDPADLTTTSKSVPASTTTSSERGITPPPTQSSVQSRTEPPSSSSTSGPAADANTQPSGGGVANNVGAITGGVVGCVALLCGFGLAAVWLMRRNRNPSAKSHSPGSSPPSSDGKPELEAYEAAERAELFGRGLTEMSARGPAAYDTASYHPGYRPGYAPMTPVELPVAVGR
ncbi:hypothetical protein C8A00DRAFT_33894 [Chaetomidium leptoderma]|uniref:Uncharacterized protein n=1 Tax=Chaetomidium leptoderma TaxID=669021 RepID=A0AAN6VM70_9PEZI|nr:hypothetical protein C8A00DRAFT_33894 [Chaetomidium leptoderma]